MKKLIIALVAAAMAVVVNAASVTWVVNCLDYADESTVDAGTYWLVAMGDSTDVSGFKVFEDGTYSFGSGTVTETGSIPDAFSVGGTIDGLSAANNGDYYALVIWDGNDVASGGLWGVSDAVAISGVIDEPPTNGDDIFFQNGTDAYGTAIFANQAVEPIPEPTSGLLIVLGMAGLALRRRRA